ncbi:MAG: sulfatase-like hydrolase/transferase, partial [Sedimentisphaerales bacterium]
MKPKMGRRDFIRAAGLTVVSFSIQGCASNSGRLAGKAPYDKPNIVLIMADDLGYECLGCYGSTSYQTPFLDELARTGMRFEHCYSQPLCTPSRVKIMTGQYNFRNYTDFGVLGPKQKTFGHLLQDAGYVTCVAGKWQLYGSVNQRPEVRGTGSLPNQAGFDEHCLWQIEKRGSRYKDPLIVQNGKYRKDLLGKYGPDVFSDYILDFIERHRNKPFFVYFPMVLVHGPFVPTPDQASFDVDESRYESRSTKNE